VAVTGQNSCPPAGRYLAVCGQSLVTAVTGADHLPRPCGCCRHYCQDTGRRLTGAGNSRITAQRTTGDGESWTICPLLRIRRSGVCRKKCGCPPRTRRRSIHAAIGFGGGARDRTGRGRVAGNRPGDGDQDQGVTLSSAGIPREEDLHAICTRSASLLHPSELRC
jgi:hypothetical protein